MLPDFAAFPIMDGVVGQRLDAGALLDRATAFIRSWGASDVPFTIGHVLALWRLAERDLDEARPGSDAWLAASERFLAARSEYRRLFELAAADADALRQLW